VHAHLAGLASARVAATCSGHAQGDPPARRRRCGRGHEVVAFAGRLCCPLVWSRVEASKQDLHLVLFPVFSLVPVDAPNDRRGAPRGNVAARRHHPSTRQGAAPRGPPLEPWQAGRRIPAGSPNRALVRPRARNCPCRRARAELELTASQAARPKLEFLLGVPNEPPP